MKRALFITLVALLFATAAQAQGPFTGCTKVLISPANSGTDITVDTTPGGIIVLSDRSTLTLSRCGALIRNSGTVNMRCAPTANVTVSATVGFLVKPDEVLVLGLEGQQEWKCIAVSGSTTASVAEARQP